MNIDKAWSSHIPVLMEVLSLTDGEVLEIGTGFYSTPFLHWACFGKRKLVSYENSEKYMHYFKSFRSNEHDVIFVKDWSDAKIERPWDVVLVDHSPSLRRKEEIKRLANYATYIVVHDTQPETEDEYRFNEIYPLFKYRFDYTKPANHTTVLSNFVSLANLNI